MLQVKNAISISEEIERPYSFAPKSINAKQKNGFARATPIAISPHAKPFPFLFRMNVALLFVVTVISVSFRLCANLARLQEIVKIS